MIDEGTAGARYGDSASPFGFESLEVYKAAQDFRRRVYVVCGALPPTEKFALAQQMRRAAVSVTANIAEGYGRYHWQENSQFCRQSRGSLMELIDALSVCADQAYAEAESVKSLRAAAARLLRLLNGYIAYLQRQKKDKLPDKN
jgi:four helix bundle protein